MSPSDDPFSGLFSRGGAAALVDGAAWVQAMLDFEAALARSCASAGLVDAEVADQIEAACHADQFDIAAIGAGTASAGNPVVPLIAALRAATCTAAPPARTRSTLRRCWSHDAHWRRSSMTQRRRAERARRLLSPTGTR
jgi:hypothetical protein